jgi:hypothetical protein
MWDCKWRISATPCATRIPVAQGVAISADA